MKILLHLSVIMLFALSVSACGETDAVIDPEPARLGETFGNPDSGLFERAVVAADLVDTLNQPGPFTLFSPRRESVKELLSTLDLSEEEFLARDDLADFVLNHVVAGDIGRGEFTDGTLQTLADEPLTVEVREGETFIDDVRIRHSFLDYQIINGALHLIDGVLPPPSFAEAN